MQGNYVEKVRPLIEKTASTLQLKIIEIEWVNEYGEDILRIIADSSAGLTLDEATKLNEAISEALDEENIITDPYMLEVSSRGLERELLNDEEIVQSIGEYIHIDFLKQYYISKKNGVNYIEGTLEDYHDNELIVRYNNVGQIKTLKITKDQIKLIRLAIKF